jgi:arylsulfatase A-like enzyme
LAALTNPEPHAAPLVMKSPIFSVLLVTGVLAFSGVGGAEPARQAQGKPNVLFIAIDDMNDWTTLLDRGNPIKTPNLERLADRGMLFSRAYAVVPACNPSRAAILTGYRPETTRCFDNGGRIDDWYINRPDAVTLPQYFRNYGYLAKGAGKIFHHVGPAKGDDPRGTSCSWDDFQKWMPTESPHLNAYESKPLRGAAYDWGEIGGDVIQGDEKMFEYVAKRMDEKWDKPMFLAAGIFKPHLPFYAAKDFFKLYPLEKVVMPPMPANDLDDIPEIGRRMAGRESFVYGNTTQYQPPDPRSLQRMVQCYQAAASYSDSLVGRLLDKLDASGRANDTIIVLWADNGYHLGDKTSCVKFTLWEKATHVPFIIVAPGVTKPGSRCATPVSLLNIYPTLIELVGLPPKADNEGLSLVPLLKDPKAEWKHPAIMTMGEGNHAVRTERWRYIRYCDWTEELYDHDNDPWELRNLAGEPKYAGVIGDLKKMLPVTPKVSLSDKKRREIERQQDGR